MNNAISISKKYKKKHHLIKLRENDVKKRLINILSDTCEPLMALNGITFDFIFEHIRKRTDIRTIFSGEGSDEIFAGYKRYYTVLQKYNKYKNLDLFLISLNHLSIERLEKIKKNFKYKIPLLRKKLLKKLISKNPLNKYLELDQATFLPPTLEKVDGLSRRHNLELRSPYCDKNIIEFANNLESKDIINKRRDIIFQKFILRKVAEEFMPNKIVWNSNKWQFHFPSAQFLHKGVLKKLFKTHIIHNSFTSKYFHIEKIYDLLKVHEGNKWSKNDHSNTLERLLVLEIWFKLMKKYI